MTWRARFAEFGGALETPAQNAHVRWNSRRGLILDLEDETGNYGQGEASPLPGYSSDDLESTRIELQNFPWQKLAALQDAPWLDRLTFVGSQIPASCAAARNAIETALLDLWSRKQGVPAWQLLATLGPFEARKNVPLSGLLPSINEGPRALEAALDTAEARGIRSFKLKLGVTKDFAAELERARMIRKRLGAPATLRLDVNQAWTLDEARERLLQLEDLEPEFVEEPVKPSELAKLSAPNVPLALDESLQNEAIDLNQARSSGVRVLVLKPMALGGISRCLKLWSVAQSFGMRVTLSHLFDGPLAMMSAAALALGIQSDALAAGLDPHAGLNAFPALPLPAFKQWMITAWTQPGLGLPRVDVEPA